MSFLSIFIIEGNNIYSPAPSTKIILSPNTYLKISKLSAFENTVHLLLANLYGTALLIFNLNCFCKI